MQSLPLEGSGTPSPPVADWDGVEEAGETSSGSGEGAQPPPVAAKGWADESSEKEQCKRQRSSATIELAECEPLRLLSPLEQVARSAG